MEKKKLLLVSVSVGLFLVIIIGVSVLAFSPKIYNAGEGSGVLSEGRSPVVPGQTDGQDGVGNMPPVSQRGKQNTAVENIIYVNGEKTNNVKLETEDGSPARTVINIQSAPQVVRVEPKVEFPPPPAAPPVVRKADPPPPSRPRPSRLLSRRLRDGGFRPALSRQKAMRTRQGKPLAGGVWPLLSKTAL